MTKIETKKETKKTDELKRCEDFARKILFNARRGDYERAGDISEEIGLFPEARNFYVGASKKNRQNGDLPSALRTAVKSGDRELELKVRLKYGNELQEKGDLYNAARVLFDGNLTDEAYKIAIKSQDARTLELSGDIANSRNNEFWEIRAEDAYRMAIRAYNLICILKGEDTTESVRVLVEKLKKL